MDMPAPFPVEDVNARRNTCILANITWNIDIPTSAKEHCKGAP
jgi:hypothetical protein